MSTLRKASRKALEGRGGGGSALCDVTKGTATLLNGAQPVAHPTRTRLNSVFSMFCNRECSAASLEGVFCGWRAANRGLNGLPIDGCDSLRAIQGRSKSGVYSIQHCSSFFSLNTHAVMQGLILRLFMRGRQFGDTAKRATRPLSK